ncbi:MAG TPA: hypothetical protein VMB49_14305 [Acidobacteriaceae bacterium]|nr:hypothetical protein [Acidobacteriaceae bacterium]
MMTLTTSYRCAVVFKTYSWDAFVERQAHRLAAAAGKLDFYVQIDETNGSVGPIPFERVQRFTCADLEASGLPMRFGLGGVLWWNPDYAHYQFQQHHPDYDYYVFVEYDCVVQCSIEELVGRAAAQGADLLALPIARSFDTWHWRAYQHDVYERGEVKLALLNVTLHSSAALRLLRQRRVEMANASFGGWPSSEVFVPTETARAGLNWLSLAAFGDVSRCDWFPPTLEENLNPSERAAFVHPVLDRRRYIVSVLNNAASLPPGGIKRALAGFPRAEYAKLLWPAARGRAERRVRHKILRWQQQWAAWRAVRHEGAIRLPPRKVPSRKTLPGKA